MIKEQGKRRGTRRVQFEETYEVGPILVGRLGRMMVMQNRMTEAQHQAAMSKLADEYPLIVAKVNALVEDIRASLATMPPLKVLLRAYWECLGAVAGKVAEDELGRDQVLSMRMIDYVQSIIASSPNLSDPNSEISEESWNHLRGSVGELFDCLMMSFPMAQTAHRKRIGTAFEDELEGLFVQLQLNWMSVRGDRHQHFNIPHLRDLLEPHDEIARRLFGIGIGQIANGLAAIQESLTCGVGDAIEGLKILQASVEPKLEFTARDESQPDQDLATPLLQTFANADVEDQFNRLKEKLLGLALFDVELVTGWPPDFIRELSYVPGEAKEFFASGEFSGWPLRVWPVFRCPFLWVEDRAYCFDAVTIFDNFYRQFQRLILSKAPEYASQWNGAQNAVSEAIPVDLLARLLPRAEVLRQVFYHDQDWCECDAVIIFGGVLLIVEVRGGAFTGYPPTSDFLSYFAAIRNLISKPATQSHRLLARLVKDRTVELCDQHHTPIRRLNLDETWMQVPVAVTLDNFTHLAAQSASLSVLDSSLAARPVWAISIDDLRAFAEIFANPGIFCHFVAQRLKASRSSAVQVFDEMDHVGLYFRENHYVEQTLEFEGKLGRHGYSSEIDRYFAAVITGEEAARPGQAMSPRLLSLIEALERDPTRDNVRAISVLLDFDSEGRGHIDDGMEMVFREGKKKGRAQIFCLASRHLPITVSCGVEPRLMCAREPLQQEALAELPRQAGYERLILRLAMNDDGTASNAEAWFVDKSMITDANRTELALRSQQQAERRWAHYEGRKPGRNDPCPCGSGAKFKKCCGK